MTVPRLTKEQSVIISAYTGFLVVNFSDMHEYIEKKMGRPVLTHEMGEIDFCNNLRELVKEDLYSICYEGE